MPTRSRRTAPPEALPATPALVVRRIPFSETDLVVHFATPTFGRTACFARAARRSVRRFPSGFPTFAVMEIRLGAPPRTEGLRPILEGHVVRPNLGVSSDLRRFAAGCLALEIARETLPEDQPEPEAFEALESYIRSLDEAPFDVAGLVAAEMRILGPLGLAPQLARCVLCDRPAPPGRAALFDPKRGGIVCRRCGGAAEAITGAAREAMLAAVAPSEVADPPRPATPAALRDAHESILAFLEYHLNRRFASANLLALVGGLL